jgi:outer membrane immunogenic protein
MYRVGLFAFTLTSVAALASAHAADMYRAPEGGGYKDAPVYGAAWTGFYVGVNGGYGWSANDSKLTTVNDGYGGTGSKSFSTSGGFGGGQIGYNWQPASSGGSKDGPASSPFVFGVEADIQGAGIDGSSALSFVDTNNNPHAAVPAASAGKNELEWFGTVRGRIGYAWGPTLAYFTGGFAFGGVKDALTLTDFSNPGNPTTKVSHNTTDTGYVLGGGVEHLFSPRWSAKIEYQYIDLGSDKLTAVIPVIHPQGSGAIATLDAEHQYHTVRVGLNYHFGTVYEPLK